jgi:hypothetical protein
MGERGNRGEGFVCGCMPSHCPAGARGKPADAWPVAVRTGAGGFVPVEWWPGGRVTVSVCASTAVRAARLCRVVLVGKQRATWSRAGGKLAPRKPFVDT